MTLSGRQLQLGVTGIALAAVATFLINLGHHVYLGHFHGPQTWEWWRNIGGPVLGTTLVCTGVPSLHVGLGWWALARRPTPWSLDGVVLTNLRLLLVEVIVVAALLLAGG